MRALFVAPYLPTHGSGGRTRLINIMRCLAHEHDLMLVAFAARDQDVSENPYPGKALPTPPASPRPGGPRGVLRFYGDRVGRLPQYASSMRRPGMLAAIREAVERFDPDIVQFETSEMGQYLGATPDRVRTLDLQDVASRWMTRAVELGTTRQQRAMMSLELVKTKRYEARIARIPDAVYVCSPLERSYLRDLSGVDAIEVANGVDTREFEPLPAPEDAHTMLFVGPLTSEANLDAIRWFLSEVYPLVRADEPRARLDIVGMPVALDVPDGVRLLGRAEDVREHVARAAVNVVPIRVASGTRYKILEAMSMGRAVVSTSPGAEGLGVVDHEHVLLADDAAGFARAVLEALRSPALRAHLGRAGRELAVAEYDWGPLVTRIAASWKRASNASKP